MDTQLEFIKDQASQRIYFKAREGRPSTTPSVTIKDRYGSTLHGPATTYVTQDPVATTLSQNATAGSREVSLTSVASLRLNQEIRLTATDGRYEDVIVKSLTNPVQLGEDLALGYASGNSAESCEFYYTLQSGDVDTLGEHFVATASYSVTGAINTFPVVLRFDVVLHGLTNPLTRSFLGDIYPDLFSQEYDEQPGEDYQPQRDEAWNRVRRQLRRFGRRPAMIVGSSDLADWALAELEYLLHKGGIQVVRGLEGEEALEHLVDELKAKRSEALSSLQFLDANEDEARDDDSAQPQVEFVR